MLRKIFYIVCLEQRKTKQQKKPTLKTTEIHQKWEPPLLATQTHPATHPAIHLETHPYQPPQPTLKPTPQPTTGHHKSTKRESRRLGLKLSVSGSSRTLGTISPASSGSDLGRRRLQRRDTMPLRSMRAGPTPWKARPRKRKAASTKRIKPREQRKRAKREEPHACFGKWFTEKNFVNRFPFSSEGFLGQLQIISVNFYFTAKQTPTNDENVLRKMFYVETNGALDQTYIVPV